MAAKRLSEALLVELETLPDFDPQFRAKVADELTKARDNYGNQRKHLEHRLAESDRKVANLAEAIASLGGSPALTQQLRDEEARKADLIEELRVLDELPKTIPELPPIEEIKAAARAAIQRLAPTDPEFGRLMKRLISQLIAYPVRLIDGGGLYIRAKMVLDLTAFVPHHHRLVVADAMRRNITVDLFDPPQRVRYRQQIVDMRNNVQKVEILPYHKLGVYKWEALGHEYPLKSIEPPTEENVAIAFKLLTAYWNKN